MKEFRFSFVALAALGVLIPEMASGQRIWCTPEICPPTVSPAPTESPAPSPSPSEVPTDTQRPSISLSPSGTPTEAPTTSEPSAHPTEGPTESPAPSPSPSEVPTLSPSLAPSVSSAPSSSASPSWVPSSYPSGAPSYSPSFAPTTTPSSIPTFIPTISAAPSSSMTPTSSPKFLIATDMQFFIPSLDGLLDQESIEEFEQITLAYLTGSILSLPGASEVSFETVRVTGQFLRKTARRRLNQMGLHVVFDVAAIIQVRDETTFDYDAFLDDFFVGDTVNDSLNNELGASSSFFHVADDRKSLGSTESKSKLSIALASVGVVLAIAGFGMVMRLRTRNTDTTSSSIVDPSLKDDLEADYAVSLKPTESYDDSISKNSNSESVSTNSPSTYPAINQFRVQLEGFKAEPDEVSIIYPSESIETSISLFDAKAMYMPALLPTESNIEIPLTPMTNYDASQFSPTGIEVDDLSIQVPSPNMTEQKSEQGINFASFLPSVFFGKGSKQSQHSSSSIQHLQKEVVQLTLDAPKLEETRPSTLSTENEADAEQNTSNHSRNSSDHTRSTISYMFSGGGRLLKRGLKRQEHQTKEIDRAQRLIESKGVSDLHPTRPPLRLDIRRHEVVCEVKHNQHGQPPYSIASPCPSNATSNATSIKVMDEVTFLRSQEKWITEKKKRFSTATVDHSGRVEVLHCERPSGYISEASEDGQ